MAELDPVTCRINRDTYLRFQIICKIKQLTVQERFNQLLQEEVEKNKEMLERLRCFD